MGTLADAVAAARQDQIAATAKMSVAVRKLQERAENAERELATAVAWWLPYHDRLRENAESDRDEARDKLTAIEALVERLRADDETEPVTRAEARHGVADELEAVLKSERTGGPN